MGAYKPTQATRQWRIGDGYNSSYTHAVKTAISVPDEIFEEAERLARQRGMSRSQLYAKAVAEYVKGERFLGVRERLNSVYGPHPSGSQQARSLPKEEW